MTTSEPPPPPGAGRAPELPASGGSRPSRITDEDRRLAVTARTAEWMLGELAFRLPVGQVTRWQRQEAAETLAELVDQLRASTSTFVIDAPR